jgi:hypothetical protein
MQYIRNTDGCHSSAFQRREQYTAQCIAERHTIPSLKGADYKFAIIPSLSLALDFRHNHIRDTRHGSPLPVETVETLPIGMSNRR